MSERILFDSESFSSDTESRTISGVILPYNATAKKGNTEFQFSKGTVTWGSKVLLNMDHDRHMSLGRATKIEETDDGLTASFKIARGARGDEALALAEDGVYSGFSVEVSGDFDTRNGVSRSRKVLLEAVGLVAYPAFGDSTPVTQVAASADSTKEISMDNKETVEAATPDVASLIKDALAEGFAAEAARHSKEIPAREAAPAIEPVTVTKEESPYRFDGQRGSYEFSTDLFDAIRFGAGDAKVRLDKFVAEAFSVATTDVNELNPNKQLPNLYVDYVAGGTPVYSSMYSGSLSDATPFVIPKYSSDSYLVNDHTEGTAPTNAGTFVTTSQTVTPAALSAYTEINREVIDAGGNPQVSGLIWKQAMVRFAETLETKAAAVLTGSSAPELGASIAVAAANDTLVNAVEAGLVGLNFVNGGERFDQFVGHVELFTALAAAVDSNNRKLIPVVNPNNSNGGASSKWRALDLGGYLLAPAKSLGASGTGQKSYIFASEAVHIWNSAPQRIDWTAAVEKVNVGLFAYYATAITNSALIYKVTYDSTV